MKPSDAFGWRNIVSGVVAILTTLAPVAVVILVTANGSAAIGSSLGFILGVALAFGVPILIFVERLLISKLEEPSRDQIIGRYLLVGGAVAVPAALYFVVPAQGWLGAWRNLPFVLLIWVCMMFVYAVVMMVSRGIYPWIHRKLWSLEKD